MSDVKISHYWSTTFLKAMKEEMNAVTVISPDALDMLQNHSWPGNIRELKNMIERLSILAAS